MDNSKHKRTTWLEFFMITDLEGNQKITCDEVSRRWWFKSAVVNAYQTDHFYEGSETLVWARFLSDEYEIEDYEHGLRMVVAWFEGKFTSRPIPQYAK